METDYSAAAEKLGSSGKERKKRADRISKENKNLNSILKKKYVPILKER